MSKPKQLQSRCQHHDVLNRRCRMPRIDTHPAFCYLHAKFEREVRDADLRRNQFLTRYATFQTATDVNQALGKVFNLLSQNRIQAKEAAVLAYVSQLLLQTLDGVKYETQLAFGFDGYEDMVRDVVDPLPDAVPGSSADPEASPGESPAIEAAVSGQPTGAPA